MKGLGKKLGKYVMRVLLGIDQLGNTLIGGAPDETISARVGRNKEKNPLAKATAKVLDFIDPGHTDEAVLNERLGKQQAEAYGDVYDPDDVEDYGFVLTESEARKEAEGAN